MNVPGINNPSNGRVPAPGQGRDAPSADGGGRFFVNYANRDGDTVGAEYRLSASDPNWTRWRA